MLVSRKLQAFFVLKAKNLDMGCHSAGQSNEFVECERAPTLPDSETCLIRNIPAAINEMQ